MRFWIYATLRIVIAVGLGGALLALFVLLFPTLAQTISRERDIVPVPIAVTVIGGILVLCLGTTLVATWQLVARAERRALFATTSLRWLDLIIGSVAVVALLVVAASVPLTRLALTDDAPGMIALCGIVFAATLGAGLILLVMRGALIDATRLQGAQTLEA